MFHVHSKNTNALTAPLAQAALMSSGLIYICVAHSTPAGAQISCTVEGLRTVTGPQTLLRETFRASGSNPGSCEAELTDMVYRWCRNFPFEGGAYCRGDWGTYQQSGRALTPRPNATTVSPGPAPFPEGGVYFTDRSTTFFSRDGSWHCAFASPGQYIIHQGAFPVRANAGIQSPLRYGRFIGTCGVPPVYFGRIDGATFFSENGESHCVFQSPQDYRTHQDRNRSRTVLNLGLQDAAKFGPFTGACLV
jgi:hypothetical protein